MTREVHAPPLNLFHERRAALTGEQGLADLSRYGSQLPLLARSLAHRSTVARASFFDGLRNSRARQASTEALSLSAAPRTAPLVPDENAERRARVSASYSNFFAEHYVMSRL